MLAAYWPSSQAAQLSRSAYRIVDLAVPAPSKGIVTTLLSEPGPHMINSCTPIKRFVTSVADSKDGSANTFCKKDSPRSRTFLSSAVRRPVPSKLASIGTAPRTVRFSTRPPAANHSRRSAEAFSLSCAETTGASGPCSSSLNTNLDKKAAAFSTTTLQGCTTSNVFDLHVSQTFETKLSKLLHKAPSTFRLQPPRAAKKAGASDAAIWIPSVSHDNERTESAVHNESSLYMSMTFPSKLFCHCTCTICRRVRRPPFVRKSDCKSINVVPSAFVNKYSIFNNAFERELGRMASAS
mmetsp:Transcript_112802/g.177477  ORF Transcript_112802/g.177477 Transcript_112802/m.177477 type:complete len:295 (+) Transcript_112802:810-1694(+)